MADEATHTQPIRMQKGKITLADLGVPSNVKIPDKRDSKGRYYVGRLFGRAKDTFTRDNPKADGSSQNPAVFEGLRGSFISAPSEPGMDQVESGSLYIPDAFHNLIAEKLLEAQKADKRATLDFALDVFSIEAKNPIGYSWIMEPALPFLGKHPLDDLMSKVKALPASQAAKQIAGKK